MVTRKELLLDLNDGIAELDASLSANTEVSDQLRTEFESLHGDIRDAAAQFEATTDDALGRLSDRLTDFREELRDTLKRGAEEVTRGIVGGHIVGMLAGGVVQQALDAHVHNPRNLMARRIYETIDIINSNASQSLSYDGTLQLLRVHEFKAEQARYIVDLLLRSGALVRDGTEEGAPVVIDAESEAFTVLNEGYKRNVLTYLTVGEPQAEEDDEEEG